MTDRKTLVLMPGLDSTGKLFEPVIPLLRPQFDLVVVTYPDLGSFNDYVDCALGQLPTTPGYSLVAESFSGPVAMAVMTQRMDQIGPSVLCAAFARSPLATMTQMANYIPSQVFSIGALGELCEDVYEVKDDDFSETQPLPLNVTSQLDGTLLKNKLTALSRIDVSALLPGISLPILQLHGTRDRIVSGHDADLIEEALPAVTRIDLDAPHLLLQTLPHRCAELITQHVTGRE